MVNTDRLCMGCMNDNGGEKICPICGYDSADDNGPQHLAVGSWLNLNRYLVGRVIEESGDGVTYIGWDNDLNAVVNIKEYFPAGIAVRSADRMTVTPAEGRALAFGRGMNEFTQLFSDLAKLPESTAILHVVDTFEAGGTVYAVQNTVSGTTLKAFLIRGGGTLKWEQVKPLFMPLLVTVSQLNEAGIVHRGICPDNIIVGRDGKLRLTGFCIKEARVEHTEFLSQLPTGFAAPEQYLENDNYAASCDVYALGAVIFRCLIGVTPPDAKDRLLSDKLTIPAKITETVPRGVLVAVANTLKVDKTERVSTVDRFYRMLEAVTAGNVALGDITAEPPAEPKKKKGSGVKYVIISILVTVVVFVGAFFWFLNHFGLMDDIFGSESSTAGNSSITTSDMTSSKSEGYGREEEKKEVPELVGKTYDDVYKLMQTSEYKKNFTLVVAGRQPSDDYARGVVCDQSIAAGEYVDSGATIEIYISQGSDMVTLPNLKGKTVSEAKAALFEAGFFSDTITFSEQIDMSGTVDPGEVHTVTYATSGNTISSGQTISVNELIIVYYCAEQAETSTPSVDVPADDTGATE